MKNVQQIAFYITLVVATLFPREALGQEPQTAFGYQGQLLENGVAVSGTFDFRISAFNAETSGERLGRAFVAEGIEVSEGLFSLVVDFGPGVFSGSARWLQVETRRGDSGDFVLLSPRQAVLPAPHAIKANEEAHLSFPLTGTVTVAPGSNQVIGTETLFGNELSVGDAVSIAEETFAVVDILSDFELLIDQSHESGAFNVNAFTDQYLLNLTDGNDVQKVVVDRTGRVGIGTESPESLLDVAGRIRIDCRLCLGWSDNNGPQPQRETCFDLRQSGRNDSQFVRLGGDVDGNDRLWLWMDCSPE